MTNELYAKFLDLIAQGAYEGYARASGGKSIVTGDRLPEYFALRAEIKSCWRGAVAGVLEFFDPHPSHPSSRVVASPTPRSNPDFPRRHCIDQMTEGELAIRAAICTIESMDCDTRLTDAVVLLGQAQAKVADFVDGVAGGQS